MKKKCLFLLSLLGSLCVHADLIPNEQFAILYPSAYDITAPHDANDVRCYEENRVGGEAFCVFDDVDTKVHWLGRNGTRPYIAYRVDTPVVVSFYSVRLPTAAQYNQVARRPDNFSLYGSNDFDGSNMKSSTWDLLDSEFDQKATWNNGDTRYFSCNPSKTAYTSYKLVLHGATPNDVMTVSHQAIRQVEFLTLPAAILNISSEPINDLVVSPAYGDIVASAEYQEGHVFTCTAPATGTSQDGERNYTFVKWELREGTDQESTLIDQGTTPTATFTYTGTKLFLKWYFDELVSVTPLTSGEGVISFENELFPAHTPTAITATPAEGWKFYRWLVTNGTVLNPTNAITTVSMEGPGTLRALFIPETSISADIYVDPIHGSDDNHGFSAATPFASVLTAVDFLTPYQEGTIHLLPGTYEIDRDITLTESIAVMGETGNPNDVVISRFRKAGYFDSRCAVLEHPQAFIANVTLSNGYIRTTESYGGGLFITEQGGTASNLVITSAFSDGNTSYGIGAYLRSSNALLTHSIIRDCTASINATGQAVNRGVGVHIYAGRIENCLIQDCVQQTVDKEDSVGGLALRPTGNDTATAVHCTIVDCIGGKAGGILAEGASRVYNTVVAGCTGFPPEEGEAAISPWVGSAACFVNCATDDTDPINETCLTGTRATFFQGTGAHPLRPNESLIDRGLAVLPTGLPGTDFAGNPRLSGSAPDIGYLEASPRATLILLQ